MEIIPGLSIETDLTLIGQGSRIRGNVAFDKFTRVQGEIEGNVQGLSGSYLVISETGSVHGQIDGDEVVIDGFVRGDVTATQKVTISESGRLIGNVRSPLFEIKFGAYFEGQAIATRGPEEKTTALEAALA